MTEITRGPGRRSTRLSATTTSATPKRPATKELLIEIGENLFGRHGFDGISLREIASAAGQSNPNVVQYHFTNKSGLVSAILEDRVGRFEDIRREMLQNLSDDSSRQARELLKILWLPSMTIRDQNGSHTFCRFLLQHMIQPDIAPHPFARFYATAPKSRAQAQEGASLIRATRLLFGRYDNLPKAVLNQRMSSLCMMFLATVIEHDNTQLRDAATPKKFNIEPILDMAIAALGAPA